ncbi:MAG TPA: hypothetical protein DDW30_02865, partial [Clostridiales bacterium]|nr:hypothetical protein [Clostridiales bacterium]
MFAQFWGRIGAFLGEYVAGPFTRIGVRDVFDILLLTALLFILYRYGRTRRAGRVLVGLAVVVLFGVA